MTFVRTALLLLTLSLPSSATLAAPATAQDVADFKRFVGLDKALVLMPEAVATERGIADAARGCVVDRLGAHFAAQLDAKLLDLLTHELVEPWREFEATAGGRKFLEYLGSRMEALVQGKPGPDIATFEASLAPDEQQAIARFKASPAAAFVMRQLVAITGVFEDAAAIGAIEQACTTSHAH